MATKYNPSIPPAKDNELLPFLDDEFVRISQTLNDVSAGYWGQDENIPERLKPGLVKFFAPGVVGPKEGIYTYGKEGVWRYGGVIPDPPPPKPLPGDWVFLPVPANGATPIGNCAYRINTAKDAVFVTFFITGGTYTNDTLLYTLPPEARPPLAVPYPVHVQDQQIQTILAYPDPPDPTAPPLDQIIYMLQNGTATSGTTPRPYVMFNEDGRVVVTWVPNTGSPVGGTFMLPLQVNP